MCSRLGSTKLGWPLRLRMLQPLPRCRLRLLCGVDIAHNEGHDCREPVAVVDLEIATLQRNQRNRRVEIVT